MSWKPSRCRRRSAGGEADEHVGERAGAMPGSAGSEGKGAAAAVSAEAGEREHSRAEPVEEPAGVLGDEVAASVGGSEDPWLVHSDPWSRAGGDGKRRRSWEDSHYQWHGGDWSSSTWSWQWGASDRQLDSWSPWWWSWPSGGTSWSWHHSGEPEDGGQPWVPGGEGGVDRHVHGLPGVQGQGDDGRPRVGERPGAVDVAWYNDSKVDESLEMNPAAWPPGSWEHHRLDDEPNGDAMETSLMSSKGSSSGARKIPSTYPPAFSASPSESYIEWKRSVKCWIAGEGGQLPEEVMGPRCLAMLKGRASVIVRHLKIEEVSQSGGLDLVFQALESSPMVMELDGQRGEKAQREFLRCRRQAGESMESFLMRVQAQRAVMEEEDPTFAVGDRFLVGYILDHAELTLKDRVMVLAAAQNQMSSVCVFPALRRMGPFLQGTVPIGKGVIDALAS